MTEQDTFDSLRRTPLKEMVQLVCSGRIAPSIDKFFKFHGWTLEEYMNAVHKIPAWNFGDE